MYPDTYYADVDHLHEAVKSLEARCDKGQDNASCSRVIANYAKN